MSNHTPYAVTLDAIGFYVVRAGGVDVLATELDGGFLLTYMGADGQEVVTFDAAEMTRLRFEAQRHRHDGAGHDARARLRAAGRYLDRRLATAVVVQERGTGYSVEFTGLSEESSDLRGLSRLHDVLDNRRLGALSA